MKKIKDMAINEQEIIFSEEEINEEEHDEVFDIDTFILKYHRKNIKIAVSTIIALWICAAKQLEDNITNTFFNILFDIFSLNIKTDNAINCKFADLENNNFTICNKVPRNLSGKCIDHQHFDINIFIKQHLKDYDHIIYKNIEKIINNEKYQANIYINTEDFNKLIKKYLDKEQIDTISPFIILILQIENEHDNIQKGHEQTHKEHEHEHGHGHEHGNEKDKGQGHNTCNGLAAKGKCKRKIPEKPKYFTIDGLHACATHNGKNSYIKNNQTHTASHEQTQHTANHEQTQNTNKTITNPTRCHGITTKNTQCLLSAKKSLATNDGYPACTKHAGNKSIFLNK